MTMDRGTGGATGTLTVQSVAQQLGLAEDKVEQFCATHNFEKKADGYVIPPDAIQQIQSWAQEQGYLRR